MNEGLIGKLGGEGDDENLDTDQEQIKRKTLNVKADNINNMFMENIGAIKESVDTFQQMEEDTIQNDPRLLYQQEQENYEQELAKLRQKLEKQAALQKELKAKTTEAAEEVAELQDAKQ
jgi:phage shock protein A